MYFCDKNDTGIGGREAGFWHTITRCSFIRDTRFLAVANQGRGAFPERSLFVYRSLHTFWLWRNGNRTRIWRFFYFKQNMELFYFDILTKKCGTEEYETVSPVRYRLSGNRGANQDPVYSGVYGFVPGLL